MEFFKESDADLDVKNVSAEFLRTALPTKYISPDKANRLIKERGKVVYGRGREEHAWTDEQANFDKVKALLINIEPIETDSAEKILKDFKEKCDKLEFQPNSFTRLDLSDLYNRARKLLGDK